MPEHPPAEPTELKSIAEHLESNRVRIVADWMNAVLDDETIPSADRLTMEALKDHFPDLLQELISALRDGGLDGVDGETRQTGRDHGRARWRRGYRLDEVIRELFRIREMIVQEVRSFCQSQASEKARERSFAILERSFDAVIAASAQEFAHSQEAEVVLRTSQMEHAYEQVQAATEQIRLLSRSRLSLLRAVVHELRNALQPVALAAVALQEGSDPVNSREIGKELAASATRLQSLLDRLRELSQLLAGEARIQPEGVDLDDVLGALETRHRPAAERKGLRLEGSQSVHPSTIVTDREKLLEIATHLLSNAIAFTTTGFVRIETLAAEDDRWVMRVTDTGSGFDPNAIRHVFSEFHSRSESAQRGLQLGLVITRHLAHLLGGEITFRSTVGEGSSFEVNLPRRLQPETA